MSFPSLLFLSDSILYYTIIPSDDGLRPIFRSIEMTQKKIDMHLKHTFVPLVQQKLVRTYDKIPKRK